MMETYALFAQENYVAIATIAHGQTELDTFDILRSLIADAKADEDSTFMFQWV